MFTVELLIDGKWKRTEQEWTTVEEAKTVAKEIDEVIIKHHTASASSYLVYVGYQTWSIDIDSSEEPINVVTNNKWAGLADYAGVRVAEVATTISINKSSWHYRFNSKIRELGSRKSLPSSLCPYFWLTVRNIVFSILVVVVMMLMIWALGSTISVNLGLTGISGFFASIGFGVLTISGMVLVAFLLFCVIMLINKAWVKFKDYRADKRIEKMNEIKLKKPDSMFTEVKRSFKDKVCPHITFKD